jgi:hypothetical protein
MLYAIVALIAFIAGGVSFVGLLIWASDDYNNSHGNNSWRRSKHS